MKTQKPKPEQPKGNANDLVRKIRTWREARSVDKAPIITQRIITLWNLFAQNDSDGMGNFIAESDGLLKEIASFVSKAQTTADKSEARDLILEVLDRTFWASDLYLATRKDYIMRAIVTAGFDPQTLGMGADRPTSIPTRESHNSTLIDWFIQFKDEELIGDILFRVLRQRADAPSYGEETPAAMVAILTSLLVGMPATPNRLRKAIRKAVRFLTFKADVFDADSPDNIESFFIRAVEYVNESKEVKANAK